MTVGKHPFLVRGTTSHAPPWERDEMAKIFILIRSAYGNDLTLYKPSSINRRVERRSGPSFTSRYGARSTPRWRTTPPCACRRCASRERERRPVT
jgi:hypothetical protein